MGYSASNDIFTTQLLQLSLREHQRGGCRKIVGARGTGCLLQGRVSSKLQESFSHDPSSIRLCIQNLSECNTNKYAKEGEKSHQAHP